MAHIDDREIRSLYDSLLKSWNERRADEMAALFVDDGSVVGFDGSQIEGKSALEQEMRRIFESHATASYVGIIREVRFLSGEVALLRAVAGMIPPGKSELNPDLNAVQALVAVREEGRPWRITLYQNTPAAFHGRPQLREAMTEELQRALHRGRH